MCSRFQPVTDPARLQAHFGVDAPDFSPPVDVWPAQQAVFIRRPRPDAQGQAPEREALPGSFGLIPHWATEAQTTQLARRTYNARSETVASKPSYRDAWRLGRHCIVPAEAIVEPDWRSGRAVPTRIRRADGLPLGLAGIWTGWRAPDGQILRSFSLLTVNADAHPLMRQYHQPQDEKRMVVILPTGAYADWLRASAQDSGRFLQRYPAERLVAEALSL